MGGAIGEWSNSAPRAEPCHWATWVAPIFSEGIPSILKRLEHPKPHHRSLWWTFPWHPPWPKDPLPADSRDPDTSRRGSRGQRAQFLCWLACPSPWPPLAPPGPRWPPGPLAGPPWPPWPPLAPPGPPCPRCPFRQIFSGGCNLVSRHGHAAPSHPWECRGAILQRKYCRCAARRPKP